MKLRDIVLKLSAVVALAAAAAPAHATNVGYAVDWQAAGTGATLTLPPTWTLAFSDDFGAMSLGGENSVGMTWFAPIHSQLGVGKLAQPGDPAIAVMGGNLILQTRKPGQKTGTDTNIQTTNSTGRGFQFQNGYVEARMKLPTAHGSHSGLWLLSMHDPKLGHGEVDIIESYGSGDTGYHAAVHWWPGTASVITKPVANSNYVKIGPSLQTDWHTYGALLDDNFVTIYYDRVQIAKIARIPEQRVPFYILLSCFTDPDRTDGYDPATMLVDYVKVWSAPK